MKLLFLEGEKGIGKSTMILNAASAMQHKGSGLFTQRLINESGETKAFSLCAYKDVKSSIAHYSAGRERTVFIQCGYGVKGVCLEVFEQAKQLMPDYRGADFIVLDEIGGVELASDKFFSFLIELLTSGIPCIGVVKSRENWEHMKGKVSTLEDTGIRYEQLREYIGMRGGDIVTLNEHNYTKITKRVHRFFKEIADE